jgi:MerR family transcriptional regulator, copper efflux regulator
MKTGMTIGVVARRTGVPVRTLRFYDRLGILRVEGRSEGNYRLFTDDVLGCVRRIKDLKAAGLTLRQIQRLARLECAGGDARVALAEAYAEARTRVSRQIARLELTLQTLESRVAEVGLDSPPRERVQRMPTRSL